MSSQPPAALPSLRLTDTQKGTIGETLAAAQLMLVSGGRFSPFVPIADDGGVDLIVFDKVTGISLPVQIKARSDENLGPSDTVQFDVRMKTFSSRVGSFLLALLLDMTEGSIGQAWLIPMAELPTIARVRPEKLSITPSAKKGSNDRYTPYRCSTMLEVARRLAAHLDKNHPQEHGPAPCA